MHLFHSRGQNDSCNSQCKVVGDAVTRITTSLFSAEVLTYSLIEVIDVGGVSFSEKWTFLNLNLQCKIVGDGVSRMFSSYFPGIV